MSFPASPWMMISSATRASAIRRLLCRPVRGPRFDRPRSPQRESSCSCGPRQFRCPVNRIRRTERRHHQPSCFANAVFESREVDGVDLAWSCVLVMLKGNERDSTFPAKMPCVRNKISLSNLTKIVLSLGCFESDTFKPDTNDHLSRISLTDPRSPSVDRSLPNRLSGIGIESRAGSVERSQQIVGGRSCCQVRRAEQTQ